MLPAAALSIPAALNNPTISWLTQVNQPINWSANNVSPSVPSVIRVDLNSVTQISAPIKERLK